MATGAARNEADMPAAPDNQAISETLNLQFATKASEAETHANGLGRMRLARAAHWQHTQQHAEFAFDECYSYMNGDWVLLPPPPPAPTEEQ